MVYCTKCGTKNEESAVHCVKCGAKLVSKDESWDKRVEKWGEDFGKRAEKWGDNFENRRECFGLPYGGIIFGLLIGAIIIIVGISALLTDSDVTRFFWPLVIIVFGLLIATGALYSLMRRR